MSDYPICLNSLHGVSCVVVGGGNVAERKVSSLLEVGASVRVVSPDLSQALLDLAAAGEIQHVSRAYRPGDLEGAFLVFAATDDRELNRAISAEAEARGCLVNVVDDPELCNFTVPAVVRRGALTVSISTGGQSPALAAYLRQRLDDSLEPEYAALLEILGGLRDRVAVLCAPEQRRELWYRLIESDLLDMLRQGMIRGAQERAVLLIDTYVAANTEG